MMKKLLMLLCGLVVATGLLASPAMGQEEDTDTTAETQQVSIPELLEKVKYVTKVKPKKKAYVYIFLRSHAKCGFCRKITPDMNKLYKEMKGKGCELIMLNGDPNTEAAKDWAKESDITIPMITPETTSGISAVVPGGGSGGTPNVMAVMADGTQIEGASGASGSTTLVATWKDMVKDAKKAEKEKKAEARKAKKAKKSKKKSKADAEEDEI